MSPPGPNLGSSIPPPGAPAQAPPPGLTPQPGPGGGDGNLRRLATLGAGAVVVVLAAVLLLSLRGGDEPTGSPLSPVAAAAERTAASPGVRVSGTGEILGGNQQMGLEFSGVMSADGERAEMVYEVASSSLPTAAAQVGPMHQIMDGTTVYMSSPAFAAGLGGKTWMKLDMSEFVGETQSSSVADAASMLEQLEATGPNPQRVGRETIRGAKTTHYTATVDPALQAQQLREAGNDEAAELLESQGTTPATVDVWIDAEGLLRRMSMSVGFDLIAGAGSQMQMTMDFSVLGSEPAIEVPSDEEVFDATELGEQALEQMAG